MATRRVDTDLVERIERACARADNADELLETLSHEVRKAVPFDGAMWFGVDPATLLAVAPARIEAMDGAYCNALWHTEFHGHEPALFRDLARSPVPAASLRDATGDLPTRSARYREFVAPQGYDDELRMVFRSGDHTWGMGALYREKGRPPFNADDAALMSALSPVVGGAVRLRAAMQPASPLLSAAPGLMVFDPEGVLVSANDEATRWLAAIHGPPDHTLQRWADLLHEMPDANLRAAIPIIPVLHRARAVAAGQAKGPVRVRLRDRGGRWLVLHASCLAGGATEGYVAVVVEPAKSAEIAPIIIEAYGLAPRERDVVGAIARGLSTPEIAAELLLSAHTVRDYIKSVFEKTGVSSRGELVAKLFAEHYYEPSHAGVVVVD